MRTGHIQAVHDKFVAEHSDEIEATHAMARAGIPMIAGAGTVPSHPLGPPTISGDQITVSMLLNQPTRITRIIEDLTLRKFLLDRVFSNGGSVTGGAVIYDVADSNELFLAAGRDVRPIAPGAEFPFVEGTYEVPQIAAVEKWGGETFITDEARDRNDSARFARKIRQLSNSIVRKINVRAMEKLNAAISTYSRSGSSVDWGSVVTAGTSASSAEDWPLATFAAASVRNETDELGINFNLVILNPQQWGQLVMIYGGLSNLRELIGELGYTFYVSNQQTAGAVKFVAEGQVGGYRVEQPLQTVTYRGSAGEHTERTFVKSSVRPVMYVDNPYAVFEYDVNG